MTKIIDRKEKVFWKSGTKNPSYGSLPYGIYYYDNDQIVHVEWYETAEERNKVMEK